MGDCNLSLSFNGNDSNEKFCKYPYKSWCSTCEKAPRRRSRSETNESCRKKCKEMKSLSPKKSNSKCVNNEYENMEFEYDYHGWHESKYNNRLRPPNIVELPTTYIVDSELSVKTYEQTTDCQKSAIIRQHQIENTLKFVDLNKQPNCYNTENKLCCAKLSTNSSRLDNQEVVIVNTDLLSSDFRMNCRQSCPLVDFACHDSVDDSNKRPVCYDTNTYFDKQTISGMHLKEQYSKEINFLREKLKLLRNSTYVPGSNNGTITKDSLIVPITQPIDVNKCSKQPKITIVQGPVVKTLKSKMGIKAKRGTGNSGNCKLKRCKIKGGNVGAASLDSTESDNSDAEDSDVVEDDIEVNDDQLEEQSESIASEPSASSSTSTGTTASSTDDSVKDSSETTVSNSVSNEIGSVDSFSWPIRPSLFPNIPPYIKFNSHDAVTPHKMPAGCKQYFKWKLSTITPIIVRKTLTNSGFAMVRSEFSRESNQWLGTWGKHMKSPMFKTLKDMQKLNHFPGTFQLGRKDRLWRNIQKMINKFGLKEFGFLPHTYVLPHELKLLKQNWDLKNRNGSDLWIIKPPASARGVGIKLINKWSQLPKKTSLVVQKYISNPYLINGSKFDLRLYVLVTSFHPLRIYLWPDGLARFASVKYSEDTKDIKDRYMHLTNYSINKLSSGYTANEDANACLGHKWTISKLMEFLSNDGIDTKHLWRSLQQLVIKTIISSEALITPLCEENMNNTYNCYELFGIDVLLDSNLKPWLLEVNISPSLHSASPLDAHVKGPLVQTLFDMAQFHFPTRLGLNVKQTPPCQENKLYSTTLSKKERSKHCTFEQFEGRDDYVYDILKDLTGDDVRHLARAEDEYMAKGDFERIFPTTHTHRYLEFMEVRYYNRLYDAWEAKYGGRRDDGITLLQTLCSQKVHLKTAPPTTITKNLPNTIPGVEVSTLQPSQMGQTRSLDNQIKETVVTGNVVELPTAVETC